MMSSMSVLTGGPSLATYLRERLQAAIADADHPPSGTVDRRNLDAIIDQLCAHHGVQRLELRVDAMSRLQLETTEAGYRQPNGQVTTQRTLIAPFHLPYTGTEELWNTRPNVTLQELGDAHPLGGVEIGGPDHLQIRIRASDISPEDLKNERAQVLSSLITKVEWVNQQVDKFNETLRARVGEHLLRHVTLTEFGHELDAAADLPLWQADTEEQVPIPLERKALRPTSTDTVTGDPASAQNPESVMAQSIYDDVVQTIEQMTRAMERTPTASKLGEEEIRDLILFVLNANYRGAVAGEVFNGEGKTDILLRWDDANAFIGECKFWHGPSAFRAAIDQMLGYVTWRDTKAALIIFIRGEKPEDVMKKAHDEIRAHHSYKSGAPSAESDLRANYVLRSKHDDERLISVALIGVVIPPAKSKPNLPLT